LERASDWETFEENGRSIAVLSASRVIPEISWDVRNQQPGVFTTYDPGILVSQIQAAKEECDFVAVYVHWGIEKNEYPEDYQRELAQAYIDAGADLVIGSHPHVLQGIEYYKGVPIVYSLGNYMFYDKIEKTALAKAVWDADGNLSLQIIPASASGAKTSVCTDEAADEILQYLESISTGIEIDDDGFVSEN
jgi:poly-gamma-glutamate synthesis protein (capsule biosynthesis protein)